jgi:outer membrane protein assembly factor BamB
MVRRLIFALLLIVLSLLASVEDSLHAQDTNDVAMFRGNAARTGETPGPGPDPAHGVDDRWFLETAGGVLSSPLIVDGVVYATSVDGYVYALDAVTGAEMWRISTGEKFAESTPAVVDGFMYVGSDRGSVFAIDVATGEERWKFETEGSVLSSPAVVNGVAYIGSEDNNVYALDARAGTERWRFNTGESVSSSPAVVDGTVYFGSSDGSVYALEAEAGLEQWHFETDDAVVSSPAVAAGTVYIGSNDGSIYALDVSSGTMKWQFGTGEPVVSSPAVVEGVVYIGSYDNHVYALDSTTGSLQWQFPARAAVASSPVVADGVIYFGSEDGLFYALEASGTELWRVQIGGNFRGSPAVVNGLVYVGSYFGSVIALQAAEPTLGVGATAEVQKDDAPLRGGPGETTVVRATLDVGTRVTITGAAEMVDQTEWWPVVVIGSDAQGWINSSYLQAVWPEAAMTPTTEGDESDTKGDDGVSDEAVFQDCGFPDADLAEIIEDDVRLRSTPEIDPANILSTLQAGTVVLVISDGFAEDDEGNTFLHVCDSETAQTGYVISEFIELVPNEQ